jgi:serine/threonine-protein kinase
MTSSPECNPTSLGNALYCLIELGSWELARNKIDTFLSSHEAQELPKYKEVIESLKIIIITHVSGLDNAINALNTSHLPATPTVIRSVIYLMEQALNNQKAAIVHQLYTKFYGSHLSPSEMIQFDCHSIWAFLWERNWKAAGELLQRYPLELISLENSPLHFLYGCWLYATEGREIAQIHFSGILETSYPRSWMLASHYLNGKIRDTRWLQKSFMWERRQLYRQLTLYYHTIGDETLEIEKQKEQLQEYIHAE